MAAAGLSLAANSFAPIGVADVAFRAGKDLYDKLSKFRNALEEVGNLLNTVKTLDAAIASVNLYLIEYGNSQYVTHDHQPLPNTDEILQGCASEFTKLSIALGAAEITSSDGWKLQWMKRSRFVLSEEEIVKSRRILDSYINALSPILSVHQATYLEEPYTVASGCLTCDRRNQIVLRQQLESARTDSGAAHNAIIEQTISSTNATQQHVANSSRAIQHAVTSTAQITQSTIQSSTSQVSRNVFDSAENIRQDILTTSGTTHRAISDVLLAIDAKSQQTESEVKTAIQSHDGKSNSRHAQTWLAVARSGSQIHREIRAVQIGMRNKKQADFALSKRQLQTASKQCTQLNQIQSGMEETKSLIASVTVTPPTDYGIRFEGTNMHTILIPLLTVAPDLAKAFSTLAAEGRMKISAAELKWLEDEFENLIDAAHFSRKQCNSSTSSTSKHMSPTSFPAVDRVVKDLHESSRDGQT